VGGESLKEVKLKMQSSSSKFQYESFKHNLKTSAVDDLLNPELKLWRVNKELKHLLPAVGPVIQRAYPMIKSFQVSTPSKDAIIKVLYIFLMAPIS